MKKLSMILVLSLLTVGLLASLSSAADQTTQIKYWETVRASNETTNPENAIVFRLGGGTDTTCNSSPRVVDVSVRAYVAQWAHWSIDAMGWEWYVRKPGTYHTDCIKGALQSNGSVAIGFKGFGDLLRSSDDNSQGTNAEVATRFGYSVGDAASYDQINWIAASALAEPEEGENQIIFPDNMALHTGFNWKLWNEIKIVDCNSPGLYEMNGTLTLTLLNQQGWIADGDFDREYFVAENNFSQAFPNGGNF